MSPIEGKWSVAPDGTLYAVPSDSEIDNTWKSIKARAEAFTTDGRTIVIVQGLGFVGAAVAAVIATASDAENNPFYFVIGVDLATANGYWKIAKLNAGIAPISSPDPELDKLTHTAVNVQGNLAATSSEEAYSLADVIIVDLPLDVEDRFVNTTKEVDIRLGPFEAALHVIGRRMRSDTLVIVETTVPIGFCERIVRPLLQTERHLRGITEPVLLAHAYERVMPGPKYVDSIRNLWRTFSGVDQLSAAAARSFLTSFINVSSYPLWDLTDTNASEMAKLLENSYRAVNIAFIHEWTILAERTGVNLFNVIDSIRVRKGTHDNIRQPGFGVGGYCLTKDPLFAQWSAIRLFDTDHELCMTVEALRINQRMPLHTFDLAVELAGGSVVGRRIGVCGVSYLPEVPDTRNSPAEELVDALLRAGASVLAQDPYIAYWPERPQVDFTRDLRECLLWAEGLIFAVPHKSYLALTADDVMAESCRFVIDAQNCIGDDLAAGFHAKGVRVAGVGKGHWRKQNLHILINE